MSEWLQERAAFIANSCSNKAGKGCFYSQQLQQQVDWQVGGIGGLGAAQVQNCLLVFKTVFSVLKFNTLFERGAGCVTLISLLPT